MYVKKIYEQGVFPTQISLMVSKSDLVKVERDQLCSPLVVVVFANKFVYLS